MRYNGLGQLVCLPQAEGYGVEEVIIESDANPCCGGEYGDAYFGGNSISLIAFSYVRND